MVIASLQLSFLSHKNLLLVNDVDASWKTLERVAYLLTLEVVNHNRDVVGFSLNRIDISDVVLSHIAIVVEAEIVEDCPVAVTA